MRPADARVRPPRVARPRARAGAQRGNPDLAAFNAARGDQAHCYPVPRYFFHPFERPPADWEEATSAGVAEGLDHLIADSRPDALLIRELWLPVREPGGSAACDSVGGDGARQSHERDSRRRVPADLVERFLGELRKADRIVAVARHFLPGLSELGFSNVACIPNALDTAIFAPRAKDRVLAERLRIEESDIVVLHASQIRPIKRPLDIVRSAREVLRRNPRVLYLIVGEGMSRDEMQALAEESGVIERFRFEPFVDNARMPRYMNLADLVVMPSEREGLSRVYLEAQACAKTLLASDIPGAREVVRHGETGLLFQKADVDDQAEKTLLAAGDSALRARIGRQARQYVERHHDIDRAVDQYMALLQLQCER